MQYFGGKSRRTSRTSGGWGVTTSMRTKERADQARVERLYSLKDKRLEFCLG